MARQNSQSTKTMSFELSNFPDEAGQLGAVLKLIEQQQLDLKGYIERIESATNDLDALENKKGVLSAEVAKIQEANETLKIKLERELEPLQEEMLDTGEKLLALKSKLGTEAQLTDKSIKELQDKVETENISYKTLLDVHQKHNQFLADEQEKVKEHIDLLNADLADIQSENIRETESLKETKSIKENTLNEIKELEKQKLDIAFAIGEFTVSLEDLKNKKLELEEQNKKAIDDAVFLFEKLKTESQNELEDLEKQKAPKRAQIMEIEADLTAVISKRDIAKAEYDKIMGMIAGFLNKKNEVERKEVIIKKKYEDAGFSW